MQSVLERRHKTAYSARELVEYQDDPDSWIVPGVIPKVGRVIVYGDGSSYKTTVMYDLCVAIASGGKMMRQFDIAPNASGPVYINSTEDSIGGNRERFMRLWRAHDTDPRNLPLWFQHEPYLLDDAQDIEDLDAEMQDKRPRVLLIDPLDSAFSGEENSSRETKPVRRFLNHLVLRYNMCVIVIHHSTKNKDTMRGSSAFYDWADTVLFIKVKRITVGDVAHKVDIAEIRATKQRNGKQGSVVTIAPIFDDVRKETYFVTYNGLNADSIAAAYNKIRILGLIKDSEPGILKSDIARILHIRQAKVSEILTELEAAGDIIENGIVNVPCGKHGGTKQVKAWRARPKISKADVLAISKMMEKVYPSRMSELTDEHLIIDPLDPSDPRAKAMVALHGAIGNKKSDGIN